MVILIRIASNSVQNSLLAFIWLCAFFTIFVLCLWKRLVRQAATSFARETLCVSIENHDIKKN